MLLRCLFLALILFAANAAAESKSDADVELRLEFIQQALDASASYSELWQRGWLSTMAFNTSISAFCWARCQQRKHRFDAAIKTVIGGNSTYEAFANPLLGHSYARQLAQMPALKPLARRQKLAYAEQLLQRAAARERYERGAASRLKSYLANLAASAIIAADGRAVDAWQSFLLVGIAIELKSRTAPTTLMAAETAYLNGDYQDHNYKKIPQWTLTSNGNNLQFNWRF